MYLTVTEDSIDLPPGAEVILRHQTWSDYQALLATRQDKAAIKISFDATTHEIRIMAPLPEHSNKSDTLSDLVKILLRHLNQDWISFDPVTLKRFKQKGIEPDACFYIQNRAAILGKKRIDLENAPPPDLALEIDLTSFTKLEDYIAIGVPELWIYRNQTLHIYLFDEQQYQESSESLLFPTILVKELIPVYVERAWNAGSSVALREFENILQEQY